MHFFGKSEFLL